MTTVDQQKMGCNHPWNRNERYTTPAMWGTDESSRVLPERQRQLLPGETARKPLVIPMVMGEVT